MAKLRRGLIVSLVLAFSMGALVNPEAALAQAGPTATVGQTEAERPLLVKVHADWCAKCKAIAKTWARVEKELDDEAHIVVLDVTDRAHAEQAERLAQELGLEEFFDAYRAKTGTVAIFEAGSRIPSRILVAETDFGAYGEALNEVRAG